MAKPSRNRRNWMKISLALFIVVAMLAALVTGLFFGLSKSPEELIRDGKTALQQGKYADALKSFQSAVDKDPNNVDALIGLGLAQYYSGNAADAVTNLKKALELDPNNPDKEQIEQLIQQSGL